MKKYLFLMVKKMLPLKYVVIVRDYYLKLSNGYDLELSIVLNNKYRRVFIDIGTNLGTYSIPASKVYKTVYSYEPNNSLARLLRASNIKNINVREIALSNYKGEAKLDIPHDQNNNPQPAQASIVKKGVGNGEIVRVTTLDSEKIDNVDVIKIDVEGAEFDVLSGAQNLIEKNKPVLIIELEERHHQGRKLADMLEEVMNYGYLPFSLSNNSKKISLGNRKGGVDVEILKNINNNNFIFMPTEN